MNTKVRNVWESVRTSFWFIPGLLVLTIGAGAFLLISLDRRIQLDPSWLLDMVYAGDPEGARTILSTIAGSMITIAGVTFSITIVALTLTTNQFGPRLLRNFIRDKGNQVVLGIFIATFMYCLIVLRSIDQAGDVLFVPGISITFAVLLALINVGVLIYFIHHISTSLQADQVTENVHRELQSHLRHLFPDEIGQTEALRAEDMPGARGQHSRVVEAPATGYLQAIDRDGLIQIARKHSLVMQVPYRPGKYITAGTPLALVWGAGVDEELAGRISAVFILGSEPTPEQDAEFSIHQLVAIAVRALSPGINDPYTAMACLDRLGSALCFLAGRQIAEPYWRDDQGRVRIYIDTVTFEGMVNAAFDQIRQYGRTSVAVTIRLLEVLQTIAEHARNSEQLQALLRQADMTVRARHESVYDPNDRQDVEKRYQALLSVVKSASFPHN